MGVTVRIAMGYLLQQVSCTFGNQTRQWTNPMSLAPGSFRVHDIGR